MYFKCKRKQKVCPFSICIISSFCSFDHGLTCTSFSFSYTMPRPRFSFVNKIKVSDIVLVSRYTGLSPGFMPPVEVCIGFAPSDMGLYERLMVCLLLLELNIRKNVAIIVETDKFVWNLLEEY